MQKLKTSLLLLSEGSGRILASGLGSELFYFILLTNLNTYTGWWRKRVME